MPDHDHFHYGGGAASGVEADVRDRQAVYLRSIHELFQLAATPTDDPLSRIPMQELLRFVRHWTDDHVQAGCTECGRFFWVMIYAGAVVPDEDGHLDLHPTVREAIAVRAEEDAARPSLHENHIHINTRPPTSPPARTPTGSARRPAPGGVLDTVADDGSLLCACGCGVQITDASPSAYYASQDCQHQALQANATDPDEVYEGEDADTLLGYEAISSNLVHGRMDRSRFAMLTGTIAPSVVDVSPALDWLAGFTPPLTGQLRERAVIVAADRDRVEVHIPPGPHHAFSLLDYTRHCSTCGADREPWTVAGPVDRGAPIIASVLNPPRPPSQPGGPRIRQQCGECRTPLPGRVYFGSVGGEFAPRTAVRFELSDGRSTASRDYDMSEFVLSTTGVSVQAVTRGQTAWRRLEQHLNDFAEQWHREYQPDTAPNPAGRFPYRIDVPPPPYRRGRRT